MEENELNKLKEQGYWNMRYHEESEKLKEKEERGWLTKAIVNKIKNRKLNKKRSQIEEKKLDIELAKLDKELREIK